MRHMGEQEPILSTAYHDRDFYGKNSLIYPVLSRRVAGLSVGINTSPSKKCNFNCIYCEVDRTEKRGLQFSIDVANSQLKKVLIDIQGGSFGNERVKAITLVGDGEPTILLNFDELIGRVMTTRDSFGLVDVKLVVISNASGLHRDTVKKGLRLMYVNNGELWAKLDAGTEDYFKRIAQTKIPFDKILSNILDTSRKWPVKIQTCFMNVAGEMPSPEEIHAYCARVNYIRASGGQISAIQFYTVSRPPAEAYVTALTDNQMDRTAQMLRENTAVPVEVYE